MTILVTGGAGNTGTELIRELAGRTDNKTRIKCFVEPESDLSYLDGFNVEYIYGDLWNLADIMQAVEGIDQIVHIAGIGMTPNILEATRRNGINRLIVVSTTGIYSRFNELSREYRNIEEQIMISNLDYTILRPTMIYGNMRDHNMHKLIKYLDRYSFFPQFGSGANLMQPVYVKDLAQAIANTLENSITHRKAYDLPGYEALTFSQIISLIASFLAKKIHPIHIPMSLALLMSRLYEVVSSHPVITYEQVLRLNEDKAYSYDEAARDLAYQPLSFAEGIKLEIEEMKAAGLLGG